MQIHSPSELDRLGDEIAELSAHLDAATARLLVLIREFDARGGWNTGFRSCAAWLSWRVGLDLGAARERVRVARALETLPLLAQALARGQVSYAKVRALTRVATPETEARLLGVARAGTAAHVERIVRGWRRVDRRAEARETTLRHASRALHVHQDEDGMVVLRGRLEPEVGALLMQALAAAREALYQRARVPDGEVGHGNVAAPGVRCQSSSDAACAWRASRGSRGANADDPACSTTCAEPSRPRLPLSGLWSGLRSRPSHSALGAGRTDDAFESRDAVPAPPSRRSRGGLSGRP
jgi:hypothetical protein